MVLKADLTPAKTLLTLPKPLSSSLGRESPHPIVWLPVENDLVGETLKVMKSILPPGDKRLVVVLYCENGLQCSVLRHKQVEKAAEAICNEGQRAMATYTCKHYYTSCYTGCEASVVIILSDNITLECIS